MRNTKPTRNLPAQDPSRRRKKVRTHSYADKSRGIRLQKALAEAGVDSRRHCEEMILEGRVRVNDEIVKNLPAWVDPEKDRIFIDGRPLKKPRRRKSTGEIVHQYVLLNKPTKTVCTNRDPEGRKRAIDLVNLPGKPRLFCVGRLDAESTGLLLLTTDGELANRLTHPRYGVHKTYEVVLKGSLDTEAVAKLAKGIFMTDRKRCLADRTAPVKLTLLKRDRERTHLRMELREGRNRQIRRMMARLGHPVKRLTRIQLGPLKLKGVVIGEWRFLTTREKQSLFRAAHDEKYKNNTQRLPKRKE